MRLTIFAAAMLGATLTAIASDPVADVRSRLAPDARQAVFEVNLDTLPSGAVVARGTVSECRLRCALMRELGPGAIDSIAVYRADSMALVSIPAASLRTRPAHSAEMATQAVMGTPVRLLEHRSEWWRVQTPDGYIAWVPDSSVSPVSKSDFDAWRHNPQRYVVVSPWQIRAYTTAAAVGLRDVVSDLVLGSIVTADGDDIVNHRLQVTLPDGRRGWVDRVELVPIDTWAAQTFNPGRILDVAYSMEGTPYLWGGTSTKAIDCSGLVKVSYLANGLILMRDASQQALTGQALDPADIGSMQAGDLLFFGNAATGRITHVAIYDAGGRYVHSSGRVKRNSLHRDSPDYLYSPLRATRIHGSEGTPGITPARNHPWYF